MIECSLIDLIPEVGHTMVPLIWLLGQPHLRWEWQAIIPSSSVVTIVFYHAMKVSCYVITPFGWLNCNYVCALLLWIFSLVSTSRYSVKVRRMSVLSALTCKSASQSCLRIPLDCLTANKSNLFGPQDCLKRCRGGHEGELVHLLGFH
jgi:hypothetical protein